MGKIYIPSEGYATGTQSVALDVQGWYPLDNRDVVDTYSNLIDPHTWGRWNAGIPGIYPGDWTLNCYEGMRVTVVRDSDPDLNGVYYLKNSHYRTDYQNPNLTLANDWVKIGSDGGSVTIDQYTIKDNNDPHLPSDTQQNGLHVVRVDGGEFN